MHRIAVRAAARLKRALHVFVLAPELVILGRQVRRVFGVHLRQVELVPSRVGDHGSTGKRGFRRGSLPVERSRIHGVELDARGCKIFAQQPGLLAAEIGERIVMLARPGLPVADQIEQAQPIDSIICTSAPTSIERSSDRVRRNGWKRSSLVWPRQKR